jgi:hypothetical protein
MRHLRHVRLVLLLILLFSVPPIVSAQGTDANWSYHNFVFDKTFRIGGISIDDTTVAGELRLDFIHNYAGPDSLTATQRALYRRFLRKGLRVYYPPDKIDYIARRTLSSENYVGSNSNVQVFGFMEDRTAGYAADSVGNKLLWGRTVPPSSPASDTLIASGPRFLSTYVLKKNDSALYAQIGLPDSSEWFQISVAMKTGSIPQLWANDTTLLYMVLYRRNRTGQNDTCKCNIFSPFDTLRVTKFRWQNTNLTRNAGDNNKDASFMVNLGGQGILAPSISSTNWFGYGYGPNDSLPCLRHTCTSLLQKLRDSVPALVPAGSIVTDGIEESDLLIKVYSTRITPVTFLRTRVAQHLFAVLKDTTHFDNRITTVAENILDDSTLDSVLFRFGIIDEPAHGHFRSFGLLSSKLQRALYDHRPTEKRGLIVTYNSNADALRTLSGDLDSMKLKLVHTIAPDLYPIGNDPLPFTYSDTSQLDDEIEETLFKNLTLYNTTADHRRYTELIADKLSTFRLYNQTPTSGGGVSHWLPRVARSVDAAQFKYSRFGPAVPVYGYVHTHGYFGDISNTGYRDANDSITVRFQHRMPTAEELTVQAWLLMNCGAQGIIYSEMKFGGESFGIMHVNSPWRHDQEYDTLAQANHPTLLDWQLPKMWVGFNSRYNAVRRVNRALRHIDSVIGWRNLIYLKEQISAHDSLMSFATFPMVDDVSTERAVRNNSAFNGTGVFDPADSTYLEVTHFRPDTSDSLGTNTFSRYLLLTNRRTWPIDHAPYTTGNAGLGNIDVRRPVVKLKNSTGVMADSLIIERIDTTWQKTLALDTNVALDWLEPGWGSFYRVRPKPAGVGYTGTAYNNAVHSENPSTDATQRDRLTVYMRDSVVYLRATDSTGTWSSEWMISAAADSAYVSGARVANNMHPSLATTRDASALAIVWERRQGDSVTIEMAHFYGLPRRGYFPAPTRLRLLAPRALAGSWMVLAPSITGVDSGWAAAWGGKTGIDVVAIRNVPAPNSGDLSAIYKIKATSVDAYGSLFFPIDSASLYPSLAYVRNRDVFTTPRQLVHMAWQQGAPNSANRQFILYNRFGVNFTLTQPPTVSMASALEHVSTGLTGCGFLHPSISVDSLWIAVAFQQNTWLERRVVLRFRDTTKTLVFPRWRTPAYIWGGKVLPPDPNAPYKYYERPSVTEFPSAARSTTGNSGFDGALVWQWTNADDGVRNHQMLYRFGAVGEQEIPTGQHPTMVLVPYKKIDPYDASGVFYRGDTATRFLQWNSRLSDSVRYYPGIVRSTTEPWLAMAGSVHGRISADMTLVKPDLSDTCRSTGIGSGLHWDDLIESTQGIVPPDPSLPGLPPSFFAYPFSAESYIETIGDAEKVTRTGVFPAVGASVPIWRYFTGSDSVLAWLDQPEFNPIPGTADVKVHLELVRSSDSAVLWRGDTISARAMGDSTLDHLVMVPLTGVTPNTPVFLRLRSVVTGGLQYDFSADFRFLDDDDIGSMEKRMLPHEQKNEMNESEESASLSLSFVPNPTQGAGILETVVRVAGRLEFALYDIRGMKVGELSSLGVEQPGTYRYQFDMEALPNGAYLMVAKINGERSTIQIQVER